MHSKKLFITILLIGLFSSICLTFFSIQSQARITKKGVAVTGLLVGGAVAATVLYNKSQREKQAEREYASPEDVRPESADKKGLFRVSEQQEIEIGRQAAMETERKNRIIKDPQVQAYISNMGNKLVRHSSRPNLAYSFKVIDSKEINAFALPGGFIYIYSGLIKQVDTENELAGVVAHEIAHVAGKHGVDQISKAMKAQLLMQGASLVLGRGAMTGANLLTQGVFSKFSRDKEREADRLGASYLHQAGWNTEGMITLMEKFQRLSKGGSATFLSTHPSPAERRANISDLTSRWDREGKVDSPEFQAFKRRV